MGARLTQNKAQQSCFLFIQARVPSEPALGCQWGFFAQGQALRSPLISYPVKPRMFYGSLKDSVVIFSLHHRSGLPPGVSTVL